MIPRYRARLDLRRRDACVTMDGVFSCAREWIAAVERAEVPALAPGSVRLASGSVVEVLQHVHDGRRMAALRYDRTSPSGAWRTEVGFEPTEDGGRVFVEISSGVQDRGAPSGGGHAPRLTKMLVSTYAASAGIPLLDVPIAVVDRSGVDSLLSMLTDGSRRISIVCVAVGDAPGTPLVNEAVQLQRQLMGLAQLAVLGGDAGALLSERIATDLGDVEAGRRWSLTEGAVRVYWPDLDLRTGNPFRHRVWFTQAGETDFGPLGQELFDTLAWESAQRDEPEWIDSGVIQRMIDRDATQDAKRKAREDERFYEEYCRRLEAERERSEQENRALAEQRREANERADEAQRGRESLRYKYDQLVAETQELRRKRAVLVDRIDPERFTVVRYCKGGQRGRDCIEELGLSDETRAQVEEHLAWLSMPGSWLHPAGRLEHLKDGVHELRVNVKDHWLRLLVARLPKCRTVLVLHAFAKKSNELPQAEINIATSRLKELAAP